MDNLSVHKVSGLAELLACRGARLEYLPPYSPNLNPIEKRWPKIKADVKDDAVWIRMMAANNSTQETVVSAKAKLSILQDAITMPRAAFVERLERFPKSNGFKL